MDFLFFEFESKLLYFTSLPRVHIVGSIKFVYSRFVLVLIQRVVLRCELKAGQLLEVN